MLKKDEFIPSVI